MDNIKQVKEVHHKVVLSPQFLPIFTSITPLISGLRNASSEMLKATAD